MYENARYSISENSAKYITILSIGHRKAGHFNRTSMSFHKVIYQPVSHANNQVSSKLELVSFLLVYALHIIKNGRNRGDNPDCNFAWRSVCACVHARPKYIRKARGTRSWSVADVKQKEREWKAGGLQMESLGLCDVRVARKRESVAISLRTISQSPGPSHYRVTPRISWTRERERRWCVASRAPAH